MIERTPRFTPNLPELPSLNEGGFELEPVPVLEEQPFEYKLLKGHFRTDGSFKTSAQLRRQYIEKTDELIRKMTEGVDFVDPLTSEHSHEVPHNVVYLDKSARPVEWLVGEMWDAYAPAPGDTVPPRPHDYFVNLDKDQWKNIVDPLGVGEVDIDAVPLNAIRSLRSIYIEPKYKSHRDEDGNFVSNDLDEKIDQAPAKLDNDTVLIVDEVFASGKTLEVAEKMFREAFPTAKIAATHWMTGVAAKNGALGNADLPVWYQKAEVRGRGVGDRNTSYGEHTAPDLKVNVTQAMGRHFLSTRLPKTPIYEDDDPENLFPIDYVLDPASTQLRKELAYLATDPDVIKLPSIERDDFDERAEHLNGMSMAGIIAKKREQDRNDVISLHPSVRRRR